MGILKRYRSWLISAAIATVIALWLASGQTGSSGPAVDSLPIAEAPTDQRQSVRVRRQAAERVTRTIIVNGRTAPSRIVELKAETDGRVTETGVDRGERIERGGLIVRLDDRDRDARLAQARATVRQRELEYAAREKLKSESYVSEAQLQEAAAQLEAAKAELKRADLDIGYMTVRAPFAGALQERHVEIGDYLAAGDPVATLVDDRTLIVSANISEYDARYVVKGGRGAATLATGETVEGRIRYIAPVADVATRTFTVELELDNAGGALRGGVTAELSIPAEAVLAQRISPSLLTLDDDGNLGVKTVNERGEVEFHRADIATSSSEGVWIAGLPEFATIITVGQGFVNEGALVDTVAESDVDTAVAIKTGQRVTSK